MRCRCVRAHRAKVAHALDLDQAPKKILIIHYTEKLNHAFDRPDGNSTSTRLGRVPRSRLDTDHARRSRSRCAEIRHLAGQPRCQRGELWRRGPQRQPVRCRAHARRIPSTRLGRPPLSASDGLGRQGPDVGGTGRGRWRRPPRPGRADPPNVDRSRATVARAQVPRLRPPPKAHLAPLGRAARRKPALGRLPL